MPDFFWSFAVAHPECWGTWGDAMLLFGGVVGTKENSTASPFCFLFRVRWNKNPASSVRLPSGSCSSWKLANGVPSGRFLIVTDNAFFLQDPSLLRLLDRSSRILVGWRFAHQRFADSRELIRKKMSIFEALGQIRANRLFSPIRIEIRVIRVQSSLLSQFLEGRSPKKRFFSKRESIH